MSVEVVLKCAINRKQSNFRKKEVNYGSEHS